MSAHDTPCRWPYLEIAVIMVTGLLDVGEVCMILEHGVRNLTSRCLSFGESLTNRQAAD
jgi:hypothetical protein